MAHPRIHLQNVVGCVMDPFLFLTYGVIILIGMILVIYWYMK